LEGKIRHFDTKMNAWRPLEAGDAQIIRAGNGISHAEHVEKGGVIFQIWVDPDLSKTLGQDATYDDYKADQFPTETVNGTSIEYYAGDKGIMRLDTPGLDIRRIKVGSNPFSWDGQEDVVRSLYIIQGSGSINGKTVEQDDYIIIDDGDSLEITSHEGGIDVFAFTTLLEPGYATYAR
jgi:redox-sensitive bicupin YhaK (pirin superfamily)